MNNETAQLADYLGQMIRQATVETIRHIVGEEAASNAANNMRAIPLPGGDTEPADTEPEPAWPTAPHVWWDGMVYLRDPSDATYNTIRVGMKHSTHCDDCARFAREAVPVVMVPAAEWVILRQRVEGEEPVWDAAEALVDATEALNGETNE